MRGIFRPTNPESLHELPILNLNYLKDQFGQILEEINKWLCKLFGDTHLGP